jgi:hypothetical protein
MENCPTKTKSLRFFTRQPNLLKVKAAKSAKFINSGLRKNIFYLKEEEVIRNMAKLFAL